MHKWLLILIFTAFCSVARCLEPVSGTMKGHEYVDLGLPSGTVWATCNVGAYNVNECGDYFAWGEVRVKVSYNCKNYAFYTGPYEEITNTVRQPLLLMEMACCNCRKVMMWQPKNGELLGICLRQIRHKNLWIIVDEHG